MCTEILSGVKEDNQLDAQAIEHTQELFCLSTVNIHITIRDSDLAIMENELNKTKELSLCIFILKYIFMSKWSEGTLILSMHDETFRYETKH